MPFQLRLWFVAKLIEQGRAFQPALVNKSINSGTTSNHKIDLALKIQSSDVISPMHCRTSLKIVAEM